MTEHPEHPHVIEDPREQVPQLRGAVLPDVEPVPRRHPGVEADGRVRRREDDRGPGPRDASDLADVGQRIDHVLEDLEAGHDVEGVIGEREHGPVDDHELDTLGAGPQAGLLDGARRDVDADGAPGDRGQRHGPVSGVAPDVEDVSVRGVGLRFLVCPQVHQSEHVLAGGGRATVLDERVFLRLEADRIERARRSRGRRDAAHQRPPTRVGIATHRTISGGLRRCDRDGSSDA
jgi:hypothetical protein